jgi:hypothetical protein
MNEVFKTRREAELAAEARGLARGTYTIHYSNVGSVRNPQPSGWVILLGFEPATRMPIGNPCE